MSLKRWDEETLLKWERIFKAEDMNEGWPLHVRQCYAEIDRLKALLAAKGACPECGDEYTETCPVCQLDSHPVGIRLYDKIAVLLSLLAECEHDRRMLMGDGASRDALSDRIDRVLPNPEAK